MAMRPLRHAAKGLGLAILGVLAIVPTPVAAGTLRGTVADRDGKTAAGAEVWAAPIRVSAPPDVRRGEADADGKFAMDVPPGTWAVWARRGDEGGMTSYYAGLPEVAEGRDPAPVTILLRAPSRFRGLLLDAETGKPIAGGRFALDDARVLQADAEGRFEAPGLEMGNHEAYPLCAGYERRRVLFDTTDRPDAELEVKLAPAGKMVGRVLDERGQPIPGAVVGLQTSGTFFAGAALWEPCDADGRFVWDGLTFGRAGRLSATAAGHVDQQREGLMVTDSSPVREVSFTLVRDPAQAATKGEAPPEKSAEDRRDVIGTVTGPDGKPVPDALVRWDVNAHSDAQETRTDARGQFRLERVPQTEGILAILARGLAPAFPLVPTGNDQDVKVALETGIAIRGRVVDDVGAPLAGVEVIPSIPNPKPNWGGNASLRELNTRTDAEGRFALEGMPDAGLDFTFLGAGLSAERGRTLDRDDPAKNVVVLSGEGAIRGLVVDPAGRPVRNFRVLLQIPEGSKPGEKVGGYFAGYGGIGVSFTRDDGTFVVSDLTTGNVQDVVVLADGYGKGKAERVEAHPENRLPPAEALTIRLAPPHTLRVRAFLEGGKPVEGARVTLIDHDPGPRPGGFAWGYTDASWEHMVYGKTDADGWANFPALGFDKATVIVRAPGFARRREPWRQDEEEILVDLEPESSLSGIVRDEQGRPVGDVALSLSWGSGEQVNINIDPATGHYAASELPPGKYTLMIRQGQVAQPTQQPITLEAGKDLVKDIQIEAPDPAPKPGPG